jgi:predicted glycoside hydrolase/deacetylase ChbG (UPF0249 family)
VTRVLIVYADDFGRSHGINSGITLAHDRGIVTCASAMVRWPAAAEAAELARKQPGLGVPPRRSLRCPMSRCLWRKSA